MKKENKTQLGKILLKRKLVNPSELDTLLQEQQEDHKRLASKVIEKGLVEEIPVLKALSEQHGVPAINLDEVNINLDNLKLIPQDIAEKHLILPVEITGDTVHLAMANPSDRRVIEEIEFVSGKRIFPHVSLHNQIGATIKACYEAHSKGEKLYQGPGSDPKTVRAPSDVETSIESDENKTVIADYENDEMDFSEDDGMDFSVDIDIPLDAEVAEEKPAKKTAPASSLPPPPKKRPSKPKREGSDAAAVEKKAESKPRASKAKSMSIPPPFDPDKKNKKSQKPKEKDKSEISQKILVVDDEDDIRLLISRVLTDKGYQVVSASRGLEAIQKVQNEKPDMIILDAMLPEVHGFDICKKIKGSSKYGHIPVIMISAIYRGWRYAQDLKDSYGVDDFIEKPFKVNELIKKVQFFSKARDKEAKMRGEELSKEAERTLAAGISAYKAGNIDDAIDLLRKGISIDPLAFKLHYHLALLLGKKGLNYQAIRALENALELAPDYYPALKNLAVLYQKAGFKFKAIETWERTLGFCDDEEKREGIKRHLMNLL